MCTIYAEMLTDNLKSCWLCDECFQQESQLDDHCIEMHPTCYICDENLDTIEQCTRHMGMHDSVKEDIAAEDMLRAKFIAREFVAYWQNGPHFIGAEAMIMVEKCRHLLREKNDALDVMCGQFHQGGDISGLNLFKLSNVVFKENAHWGRLVALFAFGVKLIHYYRVNEGLQNRHIIAPWLAHVLIQYNIYCKSFTCNIL